MKNLYKNFTLLVLLCTSFCFSQQTPAPKQTKTIAIQGATAHIGNGTVIENSLITFSDGKITNIGNAETIKINTSGMEVISL